MSPFWITFYVSLVPVMVLLYLLADSGNDAKETFYRMQKEKVDNLEFLEFRANNRLDDIKARLRTLDVESKNRIRSLESVIRRMKSQSQTGEFVGNVESMSEQEHLALILKNASPSDRRILADHFKQENEFKASLSRAQKQAIRRSAETMAMAE